MKNETLALTSLFTTATEPNADHHAAAELVLILLADPAAWPDLARTLFAGNPVDITTRAGIERILQLLYAYGVVEDIRGDRSELLRLRFRAQPLLQMLRRIPGHDPHTGITKSLINRANINSL